MTYAGVSTTSCSVGALRGSRLLSTESSSFTSSLEGGVALCCGEDLVVNGRGGGGVGRGSLTCIVNRSIPGVWGVGVWFRIASTSACRPISVIMLSGGRGREMGAPAHSFS